jgi:hypothetical protein
LQALVAVQQAKGDPITNVTGFVAHLIDKQPDRLARLVAANRGAGSESTLGPPCGNCEAREGDPAAARIRADGSQCHTCHPRFLAAVPRAS